MTEAGEVTVGRLQRSVRAAPGRPGHADDVELRRVLVAIAEPVVEVL